EKASAWRLRDDLVGVLVLRVLGDIYSSWPSRSKGTGAGLLPLDPEVYTGADLALHYRDFEAGRLSDFLEHLIAHRCHVVTCVEQVDLDTVRLLGLFREGRDDDSVAAAMDLPDLFSVLRSPEASDVVSFSLELLPSVLETKRASGAQTFSMDG